MNGPGTFIDETDASWSWSTCYAIDHQLAGRNDKDFICVLVIAWHAAIATDVCLTWDLLKQGPPDHLSVVLQDLAIWTFADDPEELPTGHGQRFAFKHGERVLPLIARGLEL